MQVAASRTVTSEEADQPVIVILHYRPRADDATVARPELAQALVALREMPGCLSAVELSPQSGHPGDVCVIVQFDGVPSWQRWRNESIWAARLSNLGFQEACGPGGGFVFPPPPPVSRAKPPPRAKMAVVMWLSVYPTITVLLWALWPLVEGLPMPLRTLTLSVVMVPMMVWVIVPWVTARLGPWLRT